MVHSEVTTDSQGFVWPSKDDDILGTSGDWRAHALLQFWGADPVLARARGFRRAAHHLAEAAISGEEPQDLLVYPVGHNYRLALELQLKRLTVLAKRHLGERDGKYPMGHDLQRLWSGCRKALATLHPGLREYVDVERIVRQMAELDPGDEAFRYHVTTKGSETLAGVSQIDLRSLSEALEGVLSFLEAAESQILYEAELDAEMRADYLELEREVQREFEREMWEHIGPF